MRVRVGLHYGKAQIMYDEVTKGYDYYGNLVNAAARVESVAHGGQIVVTDSLYWAVQASDLRYTSMDLGLQQLRGLSGPLQLYQVWFAADAAFFGSRLEESLLDQAQARASYNPRFFGVVRAAYPNAWFLMGNPL